MQGDEQQLPAAEQIKELQAALRTQAKSHQQAQEALAIEEKCKRDQLQVRATTSSTLSAGMFTHSIHRWNSLSARALLLSFLFCSNQLVGSTTYI